MSTVTHLTQHLLRLEPGKNPGRQTLYNYLKVFVDGQQPLTAQILNHFYGYTLNYQYWQANSKSLGTSTRADLESFAQTHKVDFDFSEIRFPHLTQLIFLEQPSDFEQLVLQTEQQKRHQDDKSKIIHISDQQILAARLKSSSGLEIRVYGRSALIVGGQLRLIEPMTDLKYNAQLELELNVQQLLEGPMVTASRFHVNHEGCQGTMVRGHMLQRYETLASSGLAQYSELFYGLKRIERHFINPTTDPYHSEMVQLLEKTLHMIQSRHPDAKKAAVSTLQRAKAALKHIFPNDKQLTVLVTNIEYGLMPSQPEPWNTPLKTQYD